MIPPSTSPAAAVFAVILTSAAILIFMHGVWSLIKIERNLRRARATLELLSRYDELTDVEHEKLDAYMRSIRGEP